MLIMKDETGHLVDDADRLKALTHPMRRTMLRHLSGGPATSTTLGELLGAKTGTTSYHLRQLEKYGFIEEIPERSTGRERWWRRVEATRDIRLPTPDQLAPQDRPALEAFHQAWMAEERELLDRFPAAYLRDPAWAKASRGMAHVSAQELDAFFEEYIALLRKYSHRDAAPDARAVMVRLLAFPWDSSEQE